MNNGWAPSASQWWCVYEPYTAWAPGERKVAAASRFGPALASRPCPPRPPPTRSACHPPRSPHGPCPALLSPSPSRAVPLSALGPQRHSPKHPVSQPGCREPSPASAGAVGCAWSDGASSGAWSPPGFTPLCRLVARASSWRMRRRSPRRSASRSVARATPPTRAAQPPTRAPGTRCLRQQPRPHRRRRR